MQEFDVLVVGGGAAGLRAAIAAKHAGATVALISKVHPLRTNSAIAQGGLNAPLGKNDSPESFAQDTFVAGGGLLGSAGVRVLHQKALAGKSTLRQNGGP